MIKFLLKVTTMLIIYWSGKMLFEQFDSFLIAYFTGLISMALSCIIEIL